MTRMYSVLFCVAVGGAIALGGCGDDGGDSVDAAASANDASVADGAAGSDAALPDATQADAGTGAGTITIVSPELTGLVGKVLLVMATQGTTRFAGTCDQITTSPETITSVMKQPAGMNPCALGTDAVLAPGSYDITAGIYTPGQMTPEQCAYTTATVAGNVSVTLPALGACN